MTLKLVPAVLLAAVLASGALANGKGDPPAEADFCAELAVLAEALMQLRQMGGALQDALRIAGTDDLIREVVLSAWERPRFHTAENQRGEVERFRDTWHLGCVRGVE